MRVAFFLDSQAGKIFCTGSFSEQRENGRRCALIIAPFAEEMNRSRHVLSHLERSLSAAGYDVLLPDLYGTGDSEGDFRDATLNIWRADIDTAIERLGPCRELHLFGLRAGALLATDAVDRHPVHILTLLHPLAEGRQQLNQMLRLRVAVNLFGEGKQGIDKLKEQLDQGETLEIAGYRLSAQLAGDLEDLSLQSMTPNGVERVNWIELDLQHDHSLLRDSNRVIGDWSAQGIAVKTSTVICDQFWLTQEIARCPAIVDRTLQLLDG